MATKEPIVLEPGLRVLVKKDFTSDETIEVTVKAVRLDSNQILVTGMPDEKHPKMQFPPDRWIAQSRIVKALGAAA